MLAKSFDISETPLLSSTVDLFGQLEWKVGSYCPIICKISTVTAPTLNASTTVFAWVWTGSVPALPNRLLQRQIVLRRMVLQCEQSGCFHNKSRSFLLVSYPLLCLRPRKVYSFQVSICHHAYVSSILPGLRALFHLNRLMLRVRRGLRYRGKRRRFSVLDSLFCCRRRDLYFQKFLQLLLQLLLVSSC